MQCKRVYKDEIKIKQSSQNAGDLNLVNRLVRQFFENTGDLNT